MVPPRAPGPASAPRGRAIAATRTQLTARPREICRPCAGRFRAKLPTAQQAIVGGLRARHLRAGVRLAGRGVVGDPDHRRTARGRGGGGAWLKHGGAEREGRAVDGLGPSIGREGVVPALPPSARRSQPAGWAPPARADRMAISSHPRPAESLSVGWLSNGRALGGRGGTGAGRAGCEGSRPAPIQSTYSTCE